MSSVSTTTSDAALERVMARSRTRATARESSTAAQSMPRWLRWIHVYTSMISLVVVLCFAITGVTLNHPDWTFGSKPTTTTASGTLPFDPASGGTVNELSVSEYLRANGAVAGTLAEHNVVGTQGTLTYKRTGYQATVIYDTSARIYQVTKVQQGWVSVVNDLHKGRDSGSAWKFVIDAAGVFLSVVALSGLLLQLYLRRRRTAAIAAVALGGLAAVAIVVLTVRGA